MNQLLAMRAFIRVVETGSFSRAADYLSLPRSTTSKLITDLESYLSIRLLHRTTRTVTTTSEGLEYYSNAMRLVSEIEEIDNAMRGNKLNPQGHLKIEVNSVFANALLIPALPDFYQNFPNISISLGVTDRTINMLGEGVDCAIRAGTIIDSNVVARKLCDLEYITCASTDYLNKNGFPTTPIDLEKNHTLIGYFFATTGKNEPLIFENDNGRYEIDNCLYSANDGNGITNMVQAGIGIGQPLRTSIDLELASGEIKEVLGKWSRPTLPCHLIYPPNRQRRAALNFFIEWILDRFK